MFATVKKAISNLDLRSELALADPPRPKLQGYSLTKQSVDVRSDDHMAEYAELAAIVGIMPPDLGIESFKALLSKLNFPIFDLQTVIKYMDEKAAKESKGGWCWHPLREKDNRSMSFGRKAENEYGRTPVTASDYYAGPAEVQRIFLGGGMSLTAESHTHKFTRAGQQKVYDRTIPLHAMRRIAAIEKEYTGDVCFFVSDYALLPEVQYPDPFLMAVVPNVDVARGNGRFVIDFWDEPGFGVEQMLK